MDMLIVGIMMGVCSLLGLPWCVAATVLCLGHVDSLKMDTESTAPGETAQFLGIRWLNHTFIWVLLVFCTDAQFIHSFIILIYKL